MSSGIERIVLDTNVLVSGFLNPRGAPAQVVALILAGELRLVFDARILAEYAEVLARPRFALDQDDVALVLEQLEADGETVDAPPLHVELPDEDDLPFVEVARAGHADALVTGNVRHFPGRLGVHVLTPRALLQRLETQQ